MKQAAPMLSHTLAQLLQSMRVRVQLAESLSQRIANTRDIALFSVAFYSMRRGFDLSFTLALRVLRLLESAGLVFNFPFRKTLRKLVEAVVVLADAENPQTCASLGVTEYISAALAIGWDLTASCLFLVVECNGEGGSMTITAACMTAALQAHLRAGGLPDHFTMHSFRVGGSLSESLAGTAVDEITKIGGEKTERVARYYIGPTTSAGAKSKGDGRRDGGSERARDNSHAIAMDFPLYQAFQDDFAACKSGKRDIP